MAEQFDVVVIGAGPAGYHAAIRAAQLGLKTACIDAALGKDGKPALGGTCLRVGCIPSKALLDSSRQFWNMGHIFGDHGISFKDAKIDVEAMVGRKDKIVKQFTGGIGMLFKANKVAAYYGFGELQPGNVVKVTQHDGSIVELKGTNVIIAAGSDSIELPFAKFDGETIVDNVGGLDFTEVPNRLAVIGAGVIGLELGSVWKRLGAEVTILEAMPEFLAAADAEVAKAAAKEFKKQGLDIQLGARVTAAKATKKGVEVEYTQGDDNKKLTVDKLIVAVGRRPHTHDLCAKDARVDLDDKGFVNVNDNFRTSLPGVYAVGDVIGNPMLAHKGMEEGVAVAEFLAGQKPHLNYDVIPSVVYTAPEMAWVGKSEAQVKSAGIDYRVGQIPFAANGRAKAMAQQAGFVKMIADAKTDEILGVHMIGPYVSEMIQEMVVAMEYKASSEDIARIIHGHPTLGETVHEAALAVAGRPIHFPPKKKK